MKLISKIHLFLGLMFVSTGTLLASESAHEVAHGNPGPGLHLVFMEVNFIILMLGLFVVIKKPIKEFFSQRALVLKQSVGKSKEFYEKALAESQEIRTKLDNLDVECRSIVESVKQSGAEESKKIVEQSQIFADKINKDARKLVQGEISRANEELKDLTIRHIQELSKEYIKKEINNTDEERLVSKFLDRLQGSGS